MVLWYTASCNGVTYKGCSPNTQHNQRGFGFGTWVPNTSILFNFQRSAMLFDNWLIRSVWLETTWAIRLGRLNERARTLIIWDLLIGDIRSFGFSIQSCPDWLNQLLASWAVALGKEVQTTKNRNTSGTTSLDRRRNLISRSLSIGVSGAYLTATCVLSDVRRTFELPQHWYTCTYTH